MAAATAGGGGGPAGRGRVPGCRECGRGVEGWGGGLGSRAGACVEIRGGHLDGGELRGGGFESVPLTERNSEGVVPFRETTCAVSGHADGAELHGGCFRVCYSFRDSVKGGQGQGLTEWEGAPSAADARAFCRRELEEAREFLRARHPAPAGNDVAPPVAGGRPRDGPADDRLFARALAPEDAVGLPKVVA